jgi:hypothetical protein
MLKNILTVTAASVAIMMSVSSPAFASDNEVVTTPEPTSMISLAVVSLGLVGKKLSDSNQNTK